MELFKSMQYTGLILWIISCAFAAFVGGKYQIRHGILRSTVIEIGEKDKRLLKAAFILFIFGLLFIVVGAILG